MARQMDIVALREKAERAELTACTKEANTRSRVAELHARFADRQKAMVMSGGFRAARRTRLNSAHHPARGGSADSWRDAHELNELRKASHDLSRNNLIAKALVGRSASMVIGTGFTPDPDSDDDDFNTQSLELWNLWARGGGTYHGGAGRAEACRSWGAISADSRR